MPAEATPRLAHIVTSPLSAWALMRGQLRFMREHGFDVTVISAPGPMLDQVGSREGVRVIPVPMAREPSPFADLRAVFALTRTLRRLRPHVVHYSTPKASLLGALASRAAGTRLRLHTLRGLRSDGATGGARSFYLACERLACVLAHRVFCISGSLRGRAIDLRLAPAEKLCVLGSGSSNGIDSDRFSPHPEVLAAARDLRMRLGIDDDSPVVGYVGRLTRDKGVLELLRAHELLRPSFPGLRLLLVGDMEAHDAIPVEARSALSRDPSIVMTGFLPNVEIAYPVMDVLAFPTYREGFGNVVLEAAGFAIPAVATDVTGCVDAVQDGITGTLVPPRDPEALAAALRQYLDDPLRRREHGEAARRRLVSDFQPGSLWRALLDEYSGLLRSHGLPAPAGASGGAPQSHLDGRAPFDRADSAC